MATEDNLNDLQFGLHAMKMNKPATSAVEEAVDSASLNSVPLYRGTSDYAVRGAGDVASFTSHRPTAVRFAGQKKGSRVQKFPAGSLPAIKVRDHLPLSKDYHESEWVARVPKNNYGKPVPGAP